MKKSIFSILSLFLVIFVVACGDSGDSTKESDNDKVVDADVITKVDEDDQDQDQGPEDKCIAITVEKFSSMNITEGDDAAQPFWIYNAKYTPNTGKTANQVVQMLFSGPQDAKIYDLGSGDNANLGDAKQLVRVMEDIDPSTGKAGAIFMQASGSLEITNLFKQPTGAITGESSGKFHDIVLSEFTFDDKGKIIPKANPRCIRIKDGGWNTFGDCLPVCAPEGRVCGDDGCGGKCGTCGLDYGCSVDGQCEAYNCEKIELGEFSFRKVEDGPITYEAPILNPGEDKPEKLTVSLSNLSDQALDIDIPLYINPNDNYGSCLHCVLAFDDITGTSGKLIQDSKKIYFQQKGSLQVHGFIKDKYGNMTYESEGALSSGLRLVETTINTETYKSKTVQGGKCFELSNNYLWDTVKKCYPRCNDEYQWCDESGSDPVCKLKDGFCESSADCEGGKACTDHRCGTPSGDNIVLNGDFNGNVIDDLPEHWGGEKTYAKIKEFSSIVDDGNGGKALNVRMSQFNMKSAISTKPSSIGVGEYQCKLDIKGKGIISLQYFHNKLEPVGYVAGPVFTKLNIDSADWTSISGSFSIVNGVPDVFELVFYIDHTTAPEHLTIDNVVCKKLN